MTSTSETGKEFFYVVYGYGTDANEVSMDIAESLHDQWVKAQETNVKNVAEFVRYNLSEDQIAELIKSLTD